MLAEAIANDDPVLFLEPLKGYRLVKDEVPDERYRVPLGKLRVMREGSDVTLIAWSAASVMVNQAAEQLAAIGIDAEVLDLRSLNPLDVDGIKSSVEKTGRAIVIQEAPFTGGFASEIIATIQEECFYSLQTPVGRITAPDTPYPLGGLEDFYVPDADFVVSEVVALMGEQA